MANVWHLFEYAGYAFAPKKLRSATIESHMSSLKILHGIFFGFGLDTTHPAIASGPNSAACMHAAVGCQATVDRPVSWTM